ncbi:MAG: cyclase family protein [Methanothrix sp.]|nr:cyclase family protein [Methanothrix sp.]
MDLTHSFKPGIPHWEGFPNETVETVYNFSTSGFLTQKFVLVGQWGTHVDAPAHFHQGKRTVDQIDVQEMVLPLVVLDIHQKVSENPDYAVNMDDVKAWESRYGKIPEGCFVALRTDWSKRWPNQIAMLNRDQNGVFHYPGWSMEVLRYLYEDRNITASGHETTDTDPGLQTTEDNYTLESYILGRDHFQIELLAGLDKVPEYGALIVVAFPKPEGGSGFPARAFAILP